VGFAGKFEMFGEQGRVW